MVRQFGASPMSDRRFRIRQHFNMERNLVNNFACIAALCFAATAFADVAPDSHAPAGVMYEHLHRQGEWMVGYRAMFQRFDDLRHGGSDVSAGDLGARGYSLAPTSMTMTMHMLDIMYAPSDDLTLMLMPQYMTMDMSMSPVGDANHDGHGGHGTPANTASHGHDVSALGDTVLAALYRLARVANHEVIGTLGVSAPTGDVHKKNPDGTFMHYGMQIGTGTWDLLPSLTYLGRHGALSWGSQAGAALRLEDHNDSGFAFGERYHLSGWGAWRFAPWISASVRLQYTKEGDIDGHFDGPHNHTSPADRQPNYGGEWTEVGLGVNTAVQSGTLGGMRIAAEYVVPIIDNYNGYQLARQEGLNFNISRAF